LSTFNDEALASWSCSTRSPCRASGSPELSGRTRRPAESTLFTSPFDRQACRPLAELGAPAITIAAFAIVDRASSAHAAAVGRVPR
jgi:hypothetical protein